MTKTSEPTGIKDAMRSTMEELQREKLNMLRPEGGEYHRVRETRGFVEVFIPKPPRRAA